ncbi:hypothetical protein [Saccharothrix deserti]|uniref:hypothetical protein n=1 Tax=Saccharothrix deserti TaxID=2593674 RepID=UPI00131E670A|nr:hypothetical protein [Saccharothrix deserti]
MGEPNPARAAYVAFVMAHHPDRGGDAATFVTGLADLQSAQRRARYGDRQHHDHHRLPSRYDAPIIVVVRRRGLYAIPDRFRRWRDRRFRKPRVR